jgi:hypothetical protein
VADVKSLFSKKLLDHPEAKNAAALERIAMAKRRVLAVLDREIVAHQRTLEQKISAQGPEGQRIDPHLLGLALMDMAELNRVKKLAHAPTKTTAWYSNIGTKDDKIAEKLGEVAPLYSQVTGGGFGNLTGDALEVITFKCLQQISVAHPRYAFYGHFYLDQPKVNGRFDRIEPPQNVGGATTIKKADFIQFGYDEGYLAIECKNYREWLYPTSGLIKELIIKSYELKALPVLIHRKIHYSTKTNLLAPAGIIAHESYFQYYPSDQAEIAEKVQHKRSLGFTDVRPTEEPDPRTIKFFTVDLPKIIGPMAAKWNANKGYLYEWANGGINTAQLYSAIESPAGGKWVDFVPDQEEPPF